MFVLEKVEKRNETIKETDEIFQKKFFFIDFRTKIRFPIFRI